MNPTSNKRFYIIIAILVLILLGLVAFGVANFIQARKKLTVSTTNNSDSNFFDSQTATLTGKITNKDSDNITVENKAGQKRDFKLASSIIVNKFDLKKALTSASTVEDIELNKEAAISLSVKGSEFEITTIAYTPKLTFDPPASSTPAVAPPVGKPLTLPSPASASAKSSGNP